MARGKKKGGRPLIVPTTDQVKAAGALTLKGLPRAMVAAALGVSDRTYYTWLARGRRARKEDGPFFQLFQTAKRAEAKFVADCLDRIKQVGLGYGDAAPQWTALAWLLERKHPGEFGRRDGAAVKGGRGKGRAGRLTVVMGPDVVPEPCDDRPDEGGAE
jgi:hypothetical protein